MIFERKTHGDRETVEHHRTGYVNYEHDRLDNADQCNDSKRIIVGQPRLARGVHDPQYEGAETERAERA